MRNLGVLFLHPRALQAIVVLEPDASALVDRQRHEQRADLLALARRLSRARRLRPGLSEARAAATLHTLTSLESFLWLRREYGLSLRQTRETIAELARTLPAAAGRAHGAPQTSRRGSGFRLPGRLCDVEDRVDDELRVRLLDRVTGIGPPAASRAG